MLQYIKQDITTVNTGVIVHGCNAQGVMGSGVAGALRKKYPQIFEPYKKRCEVEYDKSVLLGTCTMVSINKGLYVINLITQLNYGRDGKKYANLDAITQGFQYLIDVCAHRSLFSFYVPKIGAGLGGLSWENEVGPALEEISVNNPQVTITVCEQ